MADTAGHPASPELHIVRMPGDLGPIVRCSGDLTVVTAEALRRELGLLTSLQPAALILNVAGCRTFDVDGVMLLLDAGRQLRAMGRRFFVVAGTGDAARMLHELGIDGILPVFPTETSAALALRGGGPLEAIPNTWAQARQETLDKWRAILAALPDAPANQVMREITASHGLCRRAEARQYGQNAAEEERCSFCPLFNTLGAGTEDVGCRRITQPLLDALLTGDRVGARTQVARLIEIIEQMPLPLD